MEVSCELCGSIMEEDDCLYTGDAEEAEWTCVDCLAEKPADLDAEQKELAREREYDRREEQGIDRWRGLDDDE